MITHLEPYIPPEAKMSLEEILNKHPFRLKIVNGRKTKRGDFRPTLPLATITINNNLSKEQFLITLVHEIAHLHTFLRHPKAKPHGKEWKMCFQHLMLPFLNPTIFDEPLLRVLAKHFKNPKATTDSDVQLSILLQQKNTKDNSENCFIFDLEPESLFELNHRVFQLKNKRRTRYECIEQITNKKYLVKGNAWVKIV